MTESISTNGLTLHFPLKHKSLPNLTKNLTSISSFQIHEILSFFAIIQAHYSVPQDWVKKNNRSFFTQLGFNERSFWWVNTGLQITDNIISVALEKQIFFVFDKTASGEECQHALLQEAAYNTKKIWKKLLRVRHNRTSVQTPLMEENVT